MSIAEERQEINEMEAGMEKIQERSRKKLCNSAIAEQRQPFPVVYNKTVRKKTKKEVRVLGQKEILMECALYIRSHAKEPLSVQGLSNRFGYSACHFPGCSGRKWGLP